MPNFSVAFVGTGPDPENPDWGTHSGMAYHHARGYEELEQCELVACADLVTERGQEFAGEFDLPDAAVYEDYGAMVAEHEPDFVSVCTPIPTHAAIVTDLAESGHVGAIHCEKPMANTWGDARRMTEVCDREGVQLTFNHQRRFGDPWMEAKRLLDDGVIGDLTRVEMGCSELFDYGSHLIDLCHYYVDETDPEWILGAIDYREENIKYGAHNENHAFVQWRYENGVYGVASTGVGEEMPAVHNQLFGTEGRIEVLPEGWGDDGPTLRVRHKDGTEWEEHYMGLGPLIPRAIEHIVEAYDDGRQPALSGEHALRATEIIFGAWESARQRGRVEFPLDIDDNPLEAMVEDGVLNPAPENVEVE
ncbi:Gfo/Idh/MocA family protein [Haloarchaeobius sp. HME9146]|uniref:Gfo/Idh/MocA family protein n=1 Tax=Haloarchaeobius sp. HME9146 TaxID=2978732 RepID=UPI0021C19DF7|nr:Gfo/Idh/MocA family oxidoreductase [Haloarchaeobius sp. HME9146]MCT9098040.1 Gfo/Idh/MocA family oxidoreductase [Haloarchaeobius sp. HME9146]